MSAADMVIAASLAMLFYTYFGYPLHMLVLARLAPRPVLRGPFTGRVSVLISVHNEAPRLAAKVASVLNGGALVEEVLIGSDGSTDDPASVVANLADARVRLHAFASRRGKPSVLNELMRAAQGDVVVLTDARQPFAPGALDALLAPFVDPAVGVVSGHLVFRMPQDAGDATHGVGAYWGVEKSIRLAESASGSVPGATGAFYAIRRNLLHPIPPDTLLDDVAIPMRAIALGGRCLFEPAAICHDLPSVSSSREAVRKRRTIAGNIQLMLRHPEWMLPWRQPAWWRFVGHKLLRLFAPFAWLALFAASARCAGQDRVHGALFAAQVAGWGTAWVALALARSGIRTGRLLGIAEIFLVLNLATLLAWWDALRGRYEPAWKRTV